MKYITNLGKELRKIRIEFAESLGAMAMKLGISTSYLSAIELGHKEVPDGLIKNVVKEYALSDEDGDTLYDLVYQDAKKINIDIQDESDGMRVVTAGFARMVDSDDAEIRKKRSDDLRKRLEEIFGK